MIGYLSESYSTSIIGRVCGATPVSDCGRRGDVPSGGRHRGGEMRGALLGRRRRRLWRCSFSPVRGALRSPDGLQARGSRTGKKAGARDGLAGGGSLSAGRRGGGGGGGGRIDDPEARSPFLGAAFGSQDVLPNSDHLAETLSVPWSKISARRPLI